MIGKKRCLLRPNCICIGSFAGLVFCQWIKWLYGPSRGKFLASPCGHTSDHIRDPLPSVRVSASMKTKLLSLACVAALAVACGDDPESPSPNGTIQLSAAQAALIRPSLVQLGPVHPELAWLADTIALVVGTGIEVAPVEVTTSSTSDQFYAVALQRTIRAGTANSAAFDVILFNDPSNPTDFIIVSGWTNPN